MKKIYFSLFGLLFFSSLHAQIINIPDANFKAILLLANADLNHFATDSDGNSITIDTDNNGEIDVNEALQVKRLYIDSNNINDLTGISNFSNLQLLDCSGNLLAFLDVTVLTNLQTLSCFNNQLPSLNVNGLISLQFLNCSFNQLASLNVNALINLKSLNCGGNQLPSLNVSGLTNLQELTCENNLLPSLNLNGLTNLGSLNCSNNQLPNLNLNGLTNLRSLYCSNNQLPNLNLNGLTNLQYLVCSDNQLPSLNVTGLTNLLYLNCSNNQLPSLNVTGLTNLYLLYCSNNQLSNLDLTGLGGLTYLDCSDNQLMSLDISGLTNFLYLNCSNNQLSNLDLSASSSLNSLNCSDNQLTSLNINGLSILEDLNCSYNQLASLNLSGSFDQLYTIHCDGNLFTTLNFNNLTNLLDVYCGYNNHLISVFAKNGVGAFVHFLGDPNLQYICVAQNTISYIESQISQNGYTNCHVNTYCSFTPGGTFYTIQGNNRYDKDMNGCSPTDDNYPNFQLAFTDGTNSGTLIPDVSGAYHYEVQSGTQTCNPILENPSYFNVSPTTATVTFPTTASPFIQDFCVTANGTHNDLEVIILPITNARPGFDANYQIVYKNKGTNTQNGTVNLVFDDAVLDYVSATPNASFQGLNNLTWSFNNLEPFETRIILVNLNLNDPLETPPLNAGDTLNYTVSVNGLTDETPIDNTSILNQVVTNALDPNDKTCIEGTVVAPNTVGNYVHYVIRFENTGSANAQNIVVKDLIDTTKYDVTTLVPITGSSSFSTRITNSNQVEFIFENINLPSTAGNNNGYVAFKIKTKPTLVVGDNFSNTANIYFDYNPPITTNTFTTNITDLANSTFVFNNYFRLSPVPTKDLLNINQKQNIAITSVSIYNALGQLMLVSFNPGNVIDVSDLTAGNYFIKVVSDIGISNGKFIKK